MSAAFGTKQISADQHASLAAPARDRSISVDDFIEQPLPADPESDSDADENEPAVTPTQKRPRSPIRRSNSALSFESEAEEDDDQPPPKRQRSDPHISPPQSAPAANASRAPSAPRLQLSTSPPRRATDFFSGRSPISPKNNSPTTFVGGTNAAQQSSSLPQPLNSPKLAPSPPPPSASSYVFPKSPNAPPLSVDPSVPSHATPPRTATHIAKPASSTAAPNAVLPSKRNSSGSLPVEKSATAEIRSIPFAGRSNSPAAPSTNLPPAKRSPPAASRASTSPKLPANTVINLVSSDPQPAAASEETCNPPAPKVAQIQAPKPSPTVPEASVISKGNNPQSGKRPPTGASGYPTPSSPQPNTPDTVPSVQERNSPMQIPAPTVVPSVGSNHVSQPVRAIPEHANLPPLSHDGLINIHMPKPADGGDWDRFVFFKHRPQRHAFGPNCYLSDYSPFTAVAPAVANEPPSTLCAVCGGGSDLITCSGCVCAFHAKCMAPYPVTSPPWYCKGCRSAGIPDDNPTPIPNPPSNLSLAAQALHRPIIDAKEGNPIDLVLHPSLLTMFRSHYAGNDWLRCDSCKRRRVVPNGILSESVQVPFVCSGMFWLPESEQNCLSQMDPTTARVEHFINQQAELRGERRKALLESFGNGSDDESEDSLQDDPLNVKLSARPTVRLEQRNNAVSNHATVPNGICVRDTVPKTTPPPQTDTERLIQNEQAASVQKPSGINAAANGFAPMEVDTVAPEQANHSNAESTIPVNTVASVTTQQRSATEVRLTTAGQATAAQTKTESTKQEDSIGGSITKPEDVKQDLLMYIAELELDEEMEDALTDLALSNDKTLAQIYVAFRSNKDRFKRQALRYAKRKLKAF